ncbi:MAG: nuclear transport factor 2 family protein [Gammaproteobacteria bacterium]|nr:nuclear transport factor 2 family protein [Gammaproteobacteria bacterium]MDH3381047.1 nuclear transport factor 2 family protein [Gammaproteobacteria bacterium]
MPSLKDHLEHFFDRIWAKHDREAIFELAEFESTIEGLGHQKMTTLEEFAQFRDALFELLEDVHVCVDKSIESGDWISALCSVTARCRRTGEPVAMSGNLWCRIVDGKLTHGYNHFDFISLFGVLGLLPRDTFERCMRGESLAETTGTPTHQMT